ncbi:MAG: DNA alkylation repair protein [Clostridia bacterium]|nr:DNA alkylation repair protein [Clostridia bacterium]
MNIEELIIDKLYEHQDVQYGDFQAKLTPGIARDSFIGVRVPEIRKIAKEVQILDGVDDYLTTLPHKYYEENILESAIICNIKDYDKCICILDAFLPYVDNWAVCDTMTPKVFNKNKDIVYDKIVEWASSEKTYTIRFGIEMLMCFFLGKDFNKEHISLLLNVKSDDYYVKMMNAWYLATALAKNWDDVIPFIENGDFEKWTHNKAIQKSIESYRITDEQKAYLRTLRK